MRENSRLIVSAGRLSICLLGFVSLSAGQSDEPLRPYLDAIRQQGAAPLDYVVNQLQSHDLIIFDDALHSAVEPFRFYQQLISDPRFRQKARFIFVEAISLSQQPAIDAYLSSADQKPELLFPAFQNDFSGSGWAFQTYFDLLRTVWTVNRQLPESERLRVIGVSNPVYWEGINTPRDLDLFRQSLAGFDYTMYRVILAHLEEFGSGLKGVFLTNTRHAYRGIRKGNGDFYWNSGTFFAQWHPGRSLSLRCHNVTLSIEKLRKPNEAVPRTTSGMERIDYRWIRMQDGLWDSAFAAAGNLPVALPLADTAFGSAPYVGNHMLDVAPDQTMADAYDAVLFLAPLEKLRQSALAAQIYTTEFKKELARRYRILFSPEQLEAKMKAAGVTTVAELIEKEVEPMPEKPLPQAEGVGPIDAWKRNQYQE